MDCLAPRFREALEAGLDECRAMGLDPMIWETCRSQALQEFYWHRGRPPTPEFPRPVTNVRDAMRGWHFYGCASDIISMEHRWFALTDDLTHGITGEALEALRRARFRQRDEWFGGVAMVMQKHGLAWGGNWRNPDLPHYQWGHCRPSPSQLSVDAFMRGGRAAVWRLVKAV